MARIQFKKFPLGFWACYPYGIEGMTEKEIADMADCGMTLTMSPWTSHEKKEATLRALDLCDKYGIQLILVDGRTHWSGIKNGADAYRAAMKQAYDDYGKHPATFGFFLGDEPHEDQMADCTEAYKIALEEGPGLVPYLNQNPGYAEKCKKFVKESGCKLLSYDRYNQMNPEPTGAVDFIRDFAEYKKLAEEVDVPLLSIMLSVGHFRYRVPSIDDYRWQMGVALACGANAIFWFTYHTPACNNNYRGAPISEFGIKNPTYYALQDLQKRFNAYYADLFNHVDFRGVYSVGRNYPLVNPYRPGEIASCGDTHLINVRSDLGTPALVTFFEGRDQYAGKHYVMVTNNTWDTCDKFWFSASPEVKHAWRVYANREADFEHDNWDASYYRWEHVLDCGVFLAPGQFEIFRFE